MLISQSIPSLIGGVSQVPPAMRHPATCEVADNCFPSPIDGLTKRPPSQYINTMTGIGGGTTDPLVHFISRDGNERYVMVFDGTGIPSVYDLNTGVAYTVVGDTSYLTFSGANTHNAYLSKIGAGGASLLATSTPRKTLRCISIGDSTFVVNTSWTNQQTGTGYSGAAPTFMAIIWIKASNFSQTFAININGGLAATYTTGATGNVGGDVVATNLVTSFTAHGFTGPNWSVAANGSFIAITGVSAFTIEALDSAGGNAMSVVKDSVTTFSQLPPSAYNGQIIKVTGDLSNTGNSASYYVRFFSKGTNNPGNGTWQECPAPGSLATPDLSTMPRQIQRLVDQTGSITGTIGTVYFNVTCGSWSGRTAGDTSTCPDPSFVGHTINDVFLYDNRLGFLTDSTVCMSEAGNFVNFYRQTALELLDSDPIDISSAHPRVVRLRHATPWQQSLVIFGDLVQFILGSTDGGGVTPSNVQVIAATEYDCDPTCKPVPIQNLLYFPFNLNGYVGIREYYVEYYTSKKVGKAVTDQVPKYIPGNPIKIVNCNAANLFAVQCDGDPASLYIYKYEWNGNTLYSAEKAQSAWVKWNFDQPNTTTSIYGAQFYGQTLYVVLARTTNYTGTPITTYTLESIAVDSSPTDSSATAGTTLAPFVTYLDRRIPDNYVVNNGIGTNRVQVTYLSATNQTQYIMPTAVWFDPSTFAPITRYVANATYDVGVRWPYTLDNSNTGAVFCSVVYLNGDTRNMSFWFGTTYTMRYRFSPFLIRDAQNPQGQPNLSGRLQIRTLTIRSANSGYYRVEINPTYRAQNVVTFSAQTLGDHRTPLGSVPGLAENQQMRFLVGARNDNLSIDLVNDSPLPSRFTSAEWEGLYYTRAKRA